MRDLVIGEIGVCQRDLIGQVSRQQADGFLEGCHGAACVASHQIEPTEGRIGCVSIGVPMDGLRKGALGLIEVALEAVHGTA